jgi:hypothetical protein
MESVEVSKRTSPGIADLYILGAGVSFPEHLSIETIDALGECKTVCTNLPEEHLAPLPADLKSKCKSLWGLYQEGRRRSDNYLDVVEEVLRTTEISRPTAWLTPGHPLIFDSVSAALLVRGRANGWCVRLLPAISCLDTILGEVEYDPARGLFVYDATGLVARNIQIPPTPVLLLQPSVFNTDHAKLTTRTEGPDLSPLRDYLLRFYEPSRRCAFVRSASRFAGPAQIVWSEIQQIPSVSSRDIAGSTLFIPGAPGMK